MQHDDSIPLPPLPNSSWRRHLGWELRWLMAELAGIGFGLVLELKTDQHELGLFVLGGMVYASLWVRGLRYANLRATPDKSEN